MISAIVGLIASFLVGALIAWVTREKERRAEAVEAREEELAPREPSAPLPSELGDDDDADAAAAVASAEEPVYAPYDVGGSPRFSVLAEDFVAAPPSLPEALSAPPSAPSSPRANHVVWEPDDARDSCNFCLVRFTAIRRRHHCRSCGLLVCNNCSRDRQKVPGAGVLPVRVCDACKISSIASKKGETVHIQSIRAFALHNSSAKLGGSVSRPSSPMEVVAVAPVVESDVKKLDDDEELLQMSRALYADLSQSFLSDKGMSDVDKEEEGRSVRRALFPDETAEEVTAAENGVSAIPAKFRAEEKLREAEALMNAPGWTTVLERDGVTVRRVAVSPVDAFCVQTRVKGNARKIGKNLLNLETRLKVSLFFSCVFLKTNKTVGRRSGSLWHERGGTVWQRRIAASASVKAGFRAFFVDFLPKRMHN
jgi:hypothetical protein